MFNGGSQPQLHTCFLLMAWHILAVSISSYPSSSEAVLESSNWLNLNRRMLKIIETKPSAGGWSPKTHFQ